MVVRLETKVFERLAFLLLRICSIWNERCELKGLGNVSNSIIYLQAPAMVLFCQLHRLNMKHY